MAFRGRGWMVYSYEYLQHFIQCHLSQLEEEVKIFICLKGHLGFLFLICNPEIELVGFTFQGIICGQSRIGSAPNAVLEFLEQVCTCFLISTTICNSYINIFLQNIAMCFCSNCFCLEHWYFNQALFPLLENVSKSERSGFTNRLETLIDNSSCCQQRNNHEYSIYHIFGEVFVFVRRI